MKLCHINRFQNHFAKCRSKDHQILCVYWHQFFGRCCPERRNNYLSLDDRVVDVVVLRIGSHQLAVELWSVRILAASRRGVDLPARGQIEIWRRKLRLGVGHRQAQQQDTDGGHR